MKPFSFIVLLFVCTLIFPFGCRMAELPDAVSSAGEKIQILSIGFDSAQRDSFELAKQHDFEVRIVPIGGSILDPKGSLIEQRTFYWLDFHRSSENVETDLLDALDRDSGIIILGARPQWEKYPESVREKILDRVRKGAVLSIFGASPEFQKNVSAEGRREKLKLPFDAIPGKDPFRFECWRFGRGKVITQPVYVDYRFGNFAPHIPSAERGRHRYWMERYAELLRCAWRKPRKIVLSKAKLYRQDGTFVAEGSPLASGLYFRLTEHFSEGGKLYGKSGQAFVHDTPHGIRALRFLSDTVLKPGMSMRLRADWKRKSDSGESTLLLRDIYGRVFYRNTVPGTPEIIDAVLPEGSCSVLNFAVLIYRKKNAAPESAAVEFTIPVNRTDSDFYFLSWNGALGDTVRHQDFFRELRKNGIDGVTNMAPKVNTLRSAALVGLFCVPYTAAFHKTLIPNLFDEKNFQTQRVKVIQAAELGRRYGVLAHSLGDENYVSAFKETGRFWDDPKLWKAFHVFLKRKYGSLKELNRIWKKSYGDWNEIRFAAETEFFSFEYPAAWIDYRCFIAETFLQRQKELRDEIRKIDPEVKVGWEGGEQFSSYDGYDLYQYVSEFDMSNVYARSFDSKMLPNKLFNGYCLRSFAPENALTGFWMNGIDYPFGLRSVPWLALFSGMNSIWWWHSTFPDHENSVLRHDFSPGGPFRETAREVRRIKAGPATVLKHAQTEKPKIAIHYSAVNFHASSLSGVVGHHINNLGAHQVQWCVSPASKMKNMPEIFLKMWSGGLPVGHYAPAFKAWASLVKDLNLDFTVIDRRQLETGKLNDFRILILPFAESLSDREVLAIRDFVKNGGCVIADYHTGIRNGHGSFRQQGALDDLFGIRSRRPFRVRYKKENVMIESPMGDWLAAFKLPVSFTQPGLSVTTGKILGASDSGTPVFIFNTWGMGAALYCNFDFYEYFELRRIGMENDVREYFRNFLVRYCKMPVFDSVRDVFHAPLSSTALFRFRDGAVAYTGVLSERMANGENEMTVCVPMGREGYIYDVLGKQYLGCGKQAVLKMTRGMPLFLASFPRPIPPPRWNGRQTVSAGDVLKLSLNVGTMPHSVRISVQAPDGRDQAHYGKILYLKNGTGEFVLRTALNDPLGKWQVTAEEIISGKRAVHLFRMDQKK
ncbi:MAG: hypothetical protein E7055_19975 [Lentisphaerae bacterium]|nr:hypothetical protein [Lentisphaerota bacterium]